MRLPVHTLAAGGFGAPLSPGAWSLCSDAGARAVRLYGGDVSPDPMGGLDVEVSATPMVVQPPQSGLEEHLRAADGWWENVEGRRAPWALSPEETAALTRAALLARGQRAPARGAHEASSTDEAFRLLGYQGPYSADAFSEDFHLAQQALSGGAWERAGWDPQQVRRDPALELAILQASDLERLYGPGAWRLTVDVLRDQRARGLW